MARRVDERQQTALHHGDAPATDARWGVLIAFAIVYLVWGSTYLAIRFAVESIPPLIMSGTRFLVAGGLLYTWWVVRAGNRRAAPRATRAQWREATIVGLYLIAAAYGLVSWAELTVPSGIVAVVTAMTPLWMVVIPCSAMQMLTGGAVLVVAGLVVGEGARFSVGAVTARSWLAWIYLVVAGSMVAYSAYLYLLKTTSPARASTYAYVNPIVAVTLGWLLAAEPIGWRTVAAMGLTLVAVLAINRGAVET